MNRYDIEHFLTELFGAKDPAHWIQIAQFPQGTRYFQTVGQAVTYVMRHPRDIYVARGLAGNNLGREHRASAAQVVAVAGLCVEVDYNAGPKAHKTTALPTRAEALALIRRMPLPASFIVASGHGYHAWWIFDEPWEIETDEERAEIQDISRRWQDTLRQLADDQWKIDSVYDLARVMRIPGTENHKDTAHIVEARIIEDTGRRYESLEPFWEHARTETFPLKKAGVPAQIDLPDEIGVVTIPTEKLEALIANDHLFAQALDYKGALPKDDSPSGYDLRIANKLVQAGFTDTEIAAILAEVRQRNLGAGSKGAKKGRRRDYLIRTIERARSGVSPSRSQGSMPPDVLSKRLGCTIRRVIRYQTTAGGDYYLVTDKGSLALGDITGLIEQRIFRRRLADGVGIVLPMMKGPAWQEIAQALRAMCEERDLGEETTIVSQVRAWLEQYLESHAPIDEVEPLSDEPMIYEGKIHIRLDAFTRWVNFLTDEKITQRTLGVWLRQAGIDPRVLHIGRKTTRYWWALPENWGKDDGGMEDLWASWDRKDDVAVAAHK